MSAAEQPSGVGTYTTTSPILVHAVQLTEDADWDAVAAWCGGAHRVERDISDEYVSYLMVPALDDTGPAIASHGDWVVQGITGLFFIKLPDEFATTYIQISGNVGYLEAAPAPEQDHPDRLAEIARRLLGNLEAFVDDHSDPGVEALGTIYEARQLLLGHTAPSDDLVKRAAEAIAETIGHDCEWDTPEGPCCDGTIPCVHEREPGCNACASFGWPCDVALGAARAAFTAISPFPAPLQVPDG